MLGKAHQKWWYETEIGKFYSKGDSSFRRDGESRKTSFERNWTTFVNPPFFAAWKSPPKMVVWNKPRGIRSQGCFFVSPRWGKTKKRSFQRNWTNFVNPAFCAAYKSPPKMVVWNRPPGIRSEVCFFVSQRWEKSKKWGFNAIGRPSSTRLFAVLAKARQKWWYETEIGKFDSKGDSSFRRDGENRKNAFWTKLYDLRQPGFMRCLEKSSQNGGMKPKLQNSIPRVFFRFAPMGKVEKTRFEQNYTTFVNPALCAALKSPPKMVVWNQNFKIRLIGCFFVSPRWGKSKKRVLNKIIRPSSTRVYALLLKAHPKKRYETEILKFDSQGVLNKIIRPSSTRLYALLGKAHPKWWYETEIAKFDSQGVFSFRPDGESRKNAFWTTLYDLRQPDFMRCLEKPTQNGGMKPKLQNSILRVFFCFAPMGKVEKTRFEQNYTTFVNPALCAAWKSPPKMVVWNQSCKIRFPGCFFVSPRWGKSKKRVLNKIIRPSSTRLYALLLKAHPKWWYETKILKFVS